MTRPIRLRLADKGDLPFLVNLRNDPDVAANLKTWRPLTLSRQEAWFAGLEHDPARACFIFETGSQASWQPAGLARMTDIDPVNRSVSIGADISAAFRGQGLARHLYALLLDQVFNKYNLHRAWLEVFASNKVAIHLYKRLGFQEEGRLRKAVLRDGRFQDCLVMALLEEDYRQQEKS